MNHVAKKLNDGFTFNKILAPFATGLTRALHVLVPGAQTSFWKRTCHTFAYNPLDRSNNLRHDPSFVKSCISHPEAKVVFFNRIIHLESIKDYFSPLVTEIQEGKNEYQVAWKNLQQVMRIQQIDEKDLILLGRNPFQSMIPYFATMMKNGLQSLEQSGERYVSLRTIAGNMDSHDASILAQARILLDWNAENQFCGRCGKETHISSGGIIRFCSFCKLEHHPRTDPAVIMLIHSGKKCLLGRQKIWETGRYSTLAGFMEPGESIFDTVKRETLEETGVQVDQVKFHSSQPWPFPKSLMIGCYGTAKTEDIAVNKMELDDARWFDLKEIVKMIQSPNGKHNGFSLPMSYAVSYALIRDWAKSFPSWDKLD